MQEDLQALAIDLFQLVDSDGSGSLDLREWKQCCVSLASISENFNDPEGSFEQADANGDGEISQEEFNGELTALFHCLGERQFRESLENTIQHVHKQKQARAVARIREIFRSADRDESGKLDEEEVKFVLQQCFVDDEFDVDELFFEADEDYSGEIDYEEFLKFFSEKRDLVRRMSLVMEARGDKVDRGAVLLIAVAPWILYPELVPAEWPQGTPKDFALQGSLGEGAVDLFATFGESESETVSLEISGIVGEADVEMNLKQISPSFCEVKGKLGEGDLNIALNRKTDTVLEATGSVGSLKLTLTYEKLADGFRLGGKFGSVVALQARRTEKGLSCTGSCGHGDLELTVKVSDSEVSAIGHLGSSDLELSLQV